MDYSKYYLKNYLKQQNAVEGGYDSRRSDMSGETDYSQTGEDVEQDYQECENVEIEVTPQLTGMVQTNYRLDDDEPAIIDIIPQSYDRYGNRRKGWLMTLTIITCLLLTVVVGDFATGGALLAGIGGRQESMPMVSYYAVVLKSCDSYSVARMYAEQQRLMGGAGYILKDGDKYALIGDVYNDLADANSVVNDNEGSRLINIEVKEVDFDNLFKGSSGLLRSMGGYCSGLLTQLDVIADDLSASKIDKTKALENIEVIKNNLQAQYDQLSAEVGDDKNAELLIADINATLGILSNLLNSSISRPNLVCDIRYSKVQMIINYRQLVSNFSS